MTEWTAQSLALHVATELSIRTISPDRPLPWRVKGQDYVADDGVHVTANYGLKAQTFSVDMYVGTENALQGNQPFWSLRVRDADGNEIGYVRVHDPGSPLVRLAAAVAVQVADPTQATRRFVASEVELL